MLRQLDEPPRQSVEQIGSGEVDGADQGCGVCIYDEATSVVFEVGAADPVVVPTHTICHGCHAAKLTRTTDTYDVRLGRM